MNNAEVFVFCTQMLDRFNLLLDVQREMQYELIDTKFTEWELKKLIYIFNVLQDVVLKYMEGVEK